MFVKTRRILTTALLALQGAWAAPPASVFLEDDSRLEPVGGAELVWVWSRPGFDVGQFSQFIVERPVTTAPEGRRLPPDQARPLESRLHHALVAAFGERFHVVERPGPGVLRFRTALTGVEPLAERPSGLAYADVSLRETAIEGALVDSLSGGVMFAVVDRRPGALLDRGLAGGALRWGHIKLAFEWWAGMVQEWLDETHPHPLTWLHESSPQP